MAITSKPSRNNAAGAHRGLVTVEIEEAIQHAGTSRD
jgi:hypothetical protein